MTRRIANTAEGLDKKSTIKETTAKKKAQRITITEISHNENRLTRPASEQNNDCNCTLYSTEGHAYQIWRREFSYLELARTLGNLGRLL